MLPVRRSLMQGRATRAIGGLHQGGPSGSHPREPAHIPLPGCLKKLLLPPDAGLRLPLMRL